MNFTKYYSTVLTYLISHSESFSGETELAWLIRFETPHHMSYENASKILQKKNTIFWFSIFPVQRLERYKYMDKTVEIEPNSITRNCKHYTPRALIG